MWNIVDDSRRSFRSRAVALLASLVGLFLAAPWTAYAQITLPAKLVLLGPQQQVIAGLYQGSGTNASTAVFLIHETSNFINATPCLQLVQRGFTALCAKSQFSQSAQTDWNQITLDVGYGVSYLRSLPGVRHVVLVGWSGGGAIMAYYQNVAENGIAACQAARRLDPCSNQLAGLPRADGVVMLDSIPGLAFSNMSAWDASTVKADGLTAQRNPSLYLFNPANGYNTNQETSSSYSHEFIDR